jgi:hypothetical protein
MKEPFVTLDTVISQTKILGDMELQAYLNSMDASQKTSYINSNINDTMNAVRANKSSKYSDLLDQVTGADNNITSAAYYLTRTRDLTDLATSVDNMTMTQYSASSINNGLTGRQAEINEWANSNKLDTLYFLQILFISLSLVGILCFLVSNGIINQSVFTLVSYTIGAIAIVILILRWRYTRVARDSRYWHKARFSTENDTNQGNVPYPQQLPTGTPPPKANCPG